MKSCSQPAYEQVSDAQNGQEGDKSLRFKIPPLKHKMKEGGKKKPDKKTGLPAPLNSNPDCVCLGLHLSPTSTPHLPGSCHLRDLKQAPSPLRVESEPDVS